MDTKKAQRGKKNQNETNLVDINRIQENSILLMKSLLILRKTSLGNIHLHYI